MARNLFDILKKRKIDSSIVNRRHLLDITKSTFKTAG